MGQSYRIRTEVGISKTINVQLDQDFEFLEILSLKIQQEDVYTRSCADYGVLVGRVTANNGFGIPNARVSIFIPISSVDQSNPIISSIYPYKSPTDKNEDGYRYNLLPYEKSYSKHAATGTLPSRLDVLTGSTVVEIYDKYYKFTSKTNDSGDYMIMGVPLGSQTIVMDVDLSDIGEFSLTPQDLIRMGIATESQVAGNQFKTSNDLNSLPQLVTISRTIEISPLWGEPEICQIAVNRLDFDLRDDANIDIQPTSVFMGSIYSSPDNFRIRKNCRPKDNMGNLCGLQAGPGQILAIRQTIDQDSDGNPILEVHQLEQSGNIIDASGTWLTELPMNLDYLITNEFGEKVISNDPTVGIPTKAKYRFKIKWKQPPTLTEQVRRAYFLVPNVREYGWTSPSVDPADSSNTIIQKRLASSYYFGLAWSGYTDGFFGQQEIDKLNSAIDCEDTFYEFYFNRVYTVSGLIDEYKKGAKGRFIGIKEIDDDDCASSVNKFPVNEGFKNFDFLYFLFSILMTVLQPIGLQMLLVAHILLFLYNLVLTVICFLCGIRIPVIKVYPFRFICNLLNINCDKRNFIFRLPMITYPECQTCECSQDSETTKNTDVNLSGTGTLSYLSSPELYYNNLELYYSADTDNGQFFAETATIGIAGDARASQVGNPTTYKIPLSSPTQLTSGNYIHTSSKTIPFGERINIFNQRASYFSGLNRIKVTFAKNSNIGRSHFDNTLTVMSNTSFEPGTLLTFVSVDTTSDKNYLYSANTPNGLVTGISGTTYNGSGQTQINVNYATDNYSNQQVIYTLPYGSIETNYKFPQDREYFQVITAITMSQATQIWNTSVPNSFPNLISQPTTVDFWVKGFGDYTIITSTNFLLKDTFEDFNNQYVLVMQRGVDPYSPKYVNEYGLGALFGSNVNDSRFTVTAETRVNIPIQKVSGGFNFGTIDTFSNQNSVFYQSYFFRPDLIQYSAYSTSTVGFYAALDLTNWNQTGTYPNYSTLYPNIYGPTIVSRSSSGFYYGNFGISYKYDNGEDLSGGAIIGVKNYGTIHPSQGYLGYFDYYYNTKVLYPQFLTNPMSMSNPSLNVMRTDRLPSSDILDGGSWDLNPSLLQQNINFGMYVINTDQDNISSQSFTTGADIVTPDIEGLTNSISVIESFSCEKMVGLDCYEGFGTNFQVNQNCTQSDGVENGCYLFMRRPLLDLIKDWGNFGEWAFRFRFFYGLCRGVLSQTFTNNWINGSLYAFPIQVDTFYDSQNKPYSKYCKDVIYYDENTTNFYYRSSPYNDLTNKFIGKAANTNFPVYSLNKLNLLFPTTIINLGIKDSFFQEITFDPSTKGYIMTELESTSYSDTSDLINLFVISRITDESFLAQLIPLGDNGINQLFSREQKRVDGDLVQLMSINSEVGVIKFSPEFYETIPNSTSDPTGILGTASNPVIAVWYSSTTENLQLKDYITPGRIDFRVTSTSNFLPFNYGIKSQIVPFYQWQLDNTTTIFGSQYNNWSTGSSDIVQNTRYQSLDRTIRNNPTYFQSNTSPANNDLFQRGYIFSVDSNGMYSATGAATNKFIVGAPFQFYFGTVKGDSALDKFKTKYAIVE